jgi:hypothetical protein
MIDDGSEELVARVSRFSDRPVPAKSEPPEFR